MADVSPWPSVISAAVTGLLTGAGLLIQTRMNNKREARRLDAEAETKREERRQIAEARVSDDLFKARSEWMGAFHSYYLKVRHGLTLLRLATLKAEVADEYGKGHRAAAKALLHRTSTLLLLEKDVVNRRFIQMLTLIMTATRDKNDPKLDDQLSELFLAFIGFGNVLAGIDGSIEVVISRLTAVDPGLEPTLKRLIKTVAAGGATDNKEVVPKPAA